MPIDYVAKNSALFNRAATDADGADLRNLLGTFPVSFPTDPAYAGLTAIFPRPKLRLFAGKGVRFPWLVWAAADVAGDAQTMLSVGGSWWAYVPLGSDEELLFQIRGAIEALYRPPFAIPFGRLIVTHRGRAVDDVPLTATGMETRIGFRTLG